MSDKASNQSTEYTISLDDSIIVQSNRPRHLQQRFEEFHLPKSHSGENIHALAERNRKALLSMKQEKLMKKSERVMQIMKQQKEVHGARSAEKKEQVEKSLETAAKNRSLIIQRTVELASQSVSHARAIAQIQHERTEKKIRESKQKMEEKALLASKRRQKLLKIPRSRLLDVELSDIHLDLVGVPEEAAAVIQHAWRVSKFKPLVRKFRQLGISVDTVNNLTFEEFADKINSQKVLDTVKSLLNTIKRSSFVSIKYKNPVRVFLSAYLIVGHGPHILTHKDDAENALSTISATLLESFESWLNAYKSSDSYTMIQKFNELYYEFYMKFNSWKSHDKAKYVDELIGHYLDLEKLWVSVKSQEDAETQWKPRIEIEKDRLRAQILNTYGEAGVKKLDERIEAFNSLLDKPEVELKVNTAKTTNATSITSPPLRRKSTETPKAKDEVNEWREVLSPFLGESSNPMTNEYLAHELIMDPSFELKPTEDPRMAQIKEIAKKAYADSIRAELSAGKYDKWMPSLIMDIRTQLLEMLPPQAALATNIKEVLDLELIESQIKFNAFDVEACLKFIVQRMKQMCAPVRDASIREIESMERTDLTNIFMTVLDVLELMKLDLANYRLSVLKPHLKENIVKYEREKFTALLESKQISLDVTKKWLMESVKQAQEVAASRNPENIELPETAIKYLDIYADSLISSLTSHVPFMGDNCPETFKMDEQRLVGYQNELQGIVVVASLLMLLKNTFPEFRRDTSGQDNLVSGLFVLLSDPETRLPHLQVHLQQAIKDSRRRRLELIPNKTIVESELMTNEETELVSAMVSKTLSYKDKVYSIINRRVGALLKTHIVSGKFKKEALGSNGVDGVGVQLTAFSEKLFRLVKHNREVYSPWYDVIIKQIFDSMPVPSSTGSSEPSSSA